METGTWDQLDSAKILADQAEHSKRLDWVHTFFDGIDMYLKYPEFINADHIKLTNSKTTVCGYSLAEFAMLAIMSECKN